MDNDEQLKRFLEEVNLEEIYFKSHFYIKIRSRPINEGLIRKYLKRTDLIVKIEKQTAERVNEEKYKLWIRLSNKYTLVIVIVISGKILYIVTSWTTSRKWQKQVQQ